MAGEELQQKYPDGIGTLVGRFELFENQSTTLRQYALHGVIETRDYGAFKGQKPDALLIERSPVHRVAVVGETKPPGGITKKNWMGLAKDLLDTKLRPTGAVIGYLTDGASTYWIAGQSDSVVELTREDGKALPLQINCKDAAFVAELEHLVDHIDPKSGVVAEPKTNNPELLAKEVWQTVWRLQADRPEDCLATFVEIFIYKFLDDLNLMKINANGVEISFAHVAANVAAENSFKYYNQNVRPHIKGMFPPGADGLSVINGLVLQETNRDHNIIFREILKKFQAFGSLRNTSSDFKSRLYESFLQESRTTSTFGQHFTPRKVVSAIHDMAGIAELTAGQKICDPAAGVGGFLLEQMARDLDSQWKCTQNQMVPIHDWHAYEIVPKTAILAKANALVHCGELLASQPGRLPAFAEWLNKTFVCKGNTAFGTLEDMSEDEYDLIITNPPFVVSGSAEIAKLIRSNNKRKVYFSQKSSGLEGLFVQFIIKSLKANGNAWVILPETFFLRSTDRSLRDWMFANCRIDLLVALPERTFFNTPKRVVVAHLTKRTKALDLKQAPQVLASEKTMLFAVSEIGETRDAKRLPEKSDLPGLVEAYKHHKAGVAVSTERASVVATSKLFGIDSINIRHHWPNDVARRLGLLGAEEDPTAAKKEIDAAVATMKALAEDWAKTGTLLAPPPAPFAIKKITLGEFDAQGKMLNVQPHFDLKIGKRVLKKEVHNVRSGVKLFSANVRKPFGFVSVSNAGGLANGGALWSIDSDFDCRGVSPGEVYSITDHCGQITINDPSIDPAYLAAQIRQAGLDHGFNREFRPSLELMRKLAIELPVDETGSFDLTHMQAWTAYREKMDMFKEEMSKIL